MCARIAAPQDWDATWECVPYPEWVNNLVAKADALMAAANELMKHE